MQLSSIKNAVINAPGSFYSGTKSAIGWGGRTISNGFFGAGKAVGYALNFFKDVAKSGISFCNNNSRQIGTGAAGIALVALIVYCAKRFFRPTAPATPPADPTAPMDARAARAVARAARAAAVHA